MAKKNIVNFPNANKNKFPGFDPVAQAMANARLMSSGGNKVPTDKNMTIEVNNSSLNEVIKAYLDNKNQDTLNKLINEIIKCRILIPAAVMENKQPAPKLLKTTDGKTYLPIYSDKKQIPEDQIKPIVINMPYLAANNVALNPVDNIEGIAINPFTDNLLFHKPLLERIDHVEKQKKAALSNKDKLSKGLPPGAKVVGTDENGNTTIQLSEAQYNQFERTQFEVGYIPQKLFTDGAGFIEKLIEEKETLIDSMFEDSYQQKRMYPFLPEDFAVLPLEISDSLKVIRIDMPSKNVGFGNAYRVYITWSSDTNSGRYFRITQGKEKGSIIFEEITSERKAVNLGDAPLEGTELSKILELVQGKQPEED